MIQKPILYLASLFLLLILGIVFLWLPKYQEIYNLKREIKDKKIKLQTKEQYFQQLRDFSERVKGYSSQLAKINSALPSSPEIPDTLHFLSKTASYEGLNLGKVDLEKTLPLAEGSAIKKTQFSFSLSGPYPEFKNFLLRLENNSRLIRLEEISFQAPKEGEVFSFNLKISTYSY